MPTGHRLHNDSSILTRIRTGFSPVFWVANTLELFERLAFYGSKAILSFYLAHQIGLDLATVGWLVGMFAGLTWSLPIVAGVFVDRFGFRRTLAACFFLFTIGYFLIGFGGMPAGQAFANSIGKTHVHGARAHPDRVRRIADQAVHRRNRGAHGAPRCTGRSGSRSTTRW